MYHITIYLILFLSFTVQFSSTLAEFLSSQEQSVRLAKTKPFLPGESGLPSLSSTRHPPGQFLNLFLGTKIRLNSASKPSVKNRVCVEIRALPLRAGRRVSPTAAFWSCSCFNIGKLPFTLNIATQQTSLRNCRTHIISLKCRASRTLSETEALHLCISLPGQ